VCRVVGRSGRTYGTLHIRRGVKPKISGRGVRTGWGFRFKSGKKKKKKKKERGKSQPGGIHITLGFGPNQIQ